jgi:hypothetical protein
LFSPNLGKNIHITVSGGKSMESRPNYEFAPLDERHVKDIVDLESKLKTELGEEITIIAYCKEKEHRNDINATQTAPDNLLGCRAGLDD